MKDDNIELEINKNTININLSIDLENLITSLGDADQFKVLQFLSRKFSSKDGGFIEDSRPEKAKIINKVL